MKRIHIERPKARLDRVLLGEGATTTGATLAGRRTFEGERA